jgi:hypothetical protein
MIVYGDSQFEETLGTLVAQARERIRSALSASPAPLLGDLRQLLIFCGEIEQAASDGLSALLSERGAAAHLEHLHAATAHAADAFYRTWATSSPKRLAALAEIRDALSQMLIELGSFKGAEEARLSVRVPEGFALCALYPEQYCSAALRWLKDHSLAEERRALVVGIRSIGTSIAAAVAAVLRAGGWEVQSRSVRPMGPPFAHEVDAREMPVGRAEWALVVDEGPGLSGSSMVAAALALFRAGMPRHCISFFPGRCGEPGPAASDELRTVWATTPRYVAPIEELRLPQWLAAALPPEYLAADPLQKVTDIGAGRWRKLVYPTVASWPAVCSAFERPKLLGVLQSGARVLFKYEGTAIVAGGTSRAEAVLAGLAARARRMGGPEPFGAAHGFVATPWLAGVPLARGDASPELLAEVGQHAARSAGPVLSAQEQRSGLSRLGTMLYWNTLDLLGSAAASRVLAPIRALSRAPLAETLPLYGDGRMAPQEWVRVKRGVFRKIEGIGHDQDHTVVGRQPVLWDVAGALVEWGLRGSAAGPLLTGYYASGGASLSPEMLTFYRLAYAAFRAGQCRLCAHHGEPELEERARLNRDYAHYRADLAETLYREEPL